MDSLESITEEPVVGESVSSSQRPSYFDFSSTTGLYPPQHTFDEAVIKRLDPELFDDINCTVNTHDATTMAEEEKLKTFLRIRPLSDSNAQPSIEIKDAHTVIAHRNPKLNPNRGRRQTEFQFTKVLGPECGQSGVFEECVTPIIEKFLRQENCLIFSYGATNSGKTFTMQGYGVEYGIIPRTLDTIFARIHDRQYKIGNMRPTLYQSVMLLNQQEVDNIHAKRDKIIQEANIRQELMNSYRLTTSRYSDKSTGTVDLVGAGHFFDPNVLYTNTTLFSIWVSYAELYNERVYDLLDTSCMGKNKRRRELRLVQDGNGFVYINDLTEFPVTSDEEAYKLFLAGRKNLNFAATQMNQHSSRSHSFFTIRVVSVGIGEGMVPYPKTVHRMTFCDLAGMERANQTENKGSRLQESGNINNSLTVLLKVLRVLREKQARNALIETIPFRESKLTHIFKSYFTSATHICMLVNVNPDPIMTESTLQVLQNSAIASNVIVFRPMEHNVQAEQNVSQNKVVTKPPLPPKNASRKRKVPDESIEKQEEKQPVAEQRESSDSEEYAIETVVAPKTMIQRLKILEKENAYLRARLHDSETEKDQIRHEMMKMLAEERKGFSAKLNEMRISEQIYSNRRLSLMNTQVHVSPGSNCRPPTRDMDDIDETLEEEEYQKIMEEEEECHKIREEEEEKENRMH